MKKKRFARYDSLGRITLPRQAVREVGICEKDKLLITVAEQKNQVILCPTQEEPLVFESEKQKKQYRLEMLQKPSEQWQYIRQIDDMRRVVLPQTMRNLLGWSKATDLKITWKDLSVILETAALSDNPVVRFFQKIQ